MDDTMHETRTSDTTTSAAAPLCLRCGFHPASPRIFGYCSWDCHDADDEEEDADGDSPRAA